MQITRRTFLKNSVPAAASLIIASSGKSAGQSLDALTGHDYNKDVFASLKPDDTRILEDIAAKKSHIMRAASVENLPPELIASVIYDQQRDQSLLSNLVDRYFSYLRDQSLGEGQVKPSMAALTDGKRSLSFSDTLHYRAKLLQSSTNIEYVAKTLRFFLDRENRFPGITAEELLRNPHAMAVIASEYRKGFTRSHKDQAKPNYYGYRVIAGLTEDSPIYRALDIGPDARGALISQYLYQNFQRVVDARRAYDNEMQFRDGQRLTGVGLGIIGTGVVVFYIYKSLIQEQNSSPKKPAKQI